MIDLTHKTIEELTFQQVQAHSKDSQKKALCNEGYRQILSKLGVLYYG